MHAAPPQGRLSCDAANWAYHGERQGHWPLADRRELWVAFEHGVQRFKPRAVETMIDTQCTWCGGEFVGRCYYCGRSYCQRHQCAYEEVTYVELGVTRLGILGGVCAECRNSQLNEERKKREAAQAAYWAHMPVDVRSQLSAIADPIERLIVAIRRYWIVENDSSIYSQNQPGIREGREAQSRGLISAALETLAIDTNRVGASLTWDSAAVAHWWARQAIRAGIPFSGSVKVTQPPKGVFRRVRTAEAPTWLFQGGSADRGRYYDVTYFHDAHILSDGTIVGGAGLRGWTLWRMGELLGYKAGYGDA